MEAALRHQHLFDDLPARPSSLLPARWWVMGIGLHLVMLAAPVGWYATRDTAPPERRVEVRLAHTPAPVPWRAPPTSPVPLEALPQPPVRAEASPAQAAPRPATDPETIPETRLVRQRLLDTVASMDWTSPAPSESLARPTDSPELERLYRPLVPELTNTFDGMAAPTDTEIVDRWMEPGGAHRVVIRAPDGNTYCGRQEPVDDFRPWLQMPMMFHACGGGGQRWRGVSWRNN